MNICRCCCMEWHHRGLALALSMYMHTVIFVLSLWFWILCCYNWIWKQSSFLLKLEHWLFRHLVPLSVYLQPIAREWDQTYIAIWQVSSFLLKCQQLWSRVTTWVERREIMCLVAGLEFFGKLCHLSTNEGDWQSRDAKQVLVCWLCLPILLWLIARS